MPVFKQQATMWLLHFVDGLLFAMEGHNALGGLLLLPVNPSNIHFSYGVVKSRRLLKSKFRFNFNDNCPSLYYFILCIRLGIKLPLTCVLNPLKSFTSYFPLPSFTPVSWSAP